MATVTAQIWDIRDPLADVIKEFAVEGGYVGPEDSPWVPYGDSGAKIKHLAFDVRGNWYANILWIPAPGVIGTHKHRGEVLMMCLEGTVRYLEYPWVAEPGGLIIETPGQTHTLVTDHPKGVKLFGRLAGVTEFFDEQGNHVDTLDVFWNINHYTSYCRENGIPINRSLFV